MATFQRDENGNIIDNQGNRVGLYPPDQAAFDENMNVIFPETKEEKSEIIDENGLPAEEESYELSKLKHFDIREFMDSFEDNTNAALKQLLAMQSNASPLKKGGEGIGFMADALFLATRNSFNANENTLFDILTAKVSSNPDDNSYVIHSKDLMSILPYDNVYYANKILQEATSSLEGKNALRFEIPGTDKVFSKPWHDGLIYTKPSKLDIDSGDDYIAFKPTKIFKMMVSASTIMHGAHYKITLSSQFIGYTRKLFYWLESRKNYKEYPTATKGVFTATLEELKILLDYPDKYRATDVKTKILQAAKKKFDETEGMDFSFEFEEKKNGKKILGFMFKVVDVKPGEVIEISEDTAAIEDQGDKPTVTALLTSLQLEGDEINDVYRKYKNNNRDLLFLSQAIAKVSTNPAVESKAGYLCKIMDSGLTSEYIPDKKKNSFNNFNQRTYDKDEFEKMLLNSDLN